MPQVFKVGPYRVYFWSNESDPLEPVHVHIVEGKPVANATKVWLTSRGKCYLAHNKSHIPEVALKNIMRIIEARSEEVISKWKDCFGEAEFYF